MKKVMCMLALIAAVAFAEPVWCGRGIDDFQPGTVGVVDTWHEKEVSGFSSQYGTCEIHAIKLTLHRAPGVEWSDFEYEIAVYDAYADPGGYNMEIDTCIATYTGETPTDPGLTAEVTTYFPTPVLVEYSGTQLNYFAVGIHKLTTEAQADVRLYYGVRHFSATEYYSFYWWNDDWSDQNLIYQGTSYPADYTIEYLIEYYPGQALETSTWGSIKASFQ